MIYLSQALILLFNRSFRCHLHCEFSIDQARIMDQLMDVALAVMADGARTASHCDFSMLVPAAVVTLFVGFRPGYHWRLAMKMLYPCVTGRCSPTMASARVR